MSSSKVAKRRRLDGNERIAETPRANKRRATSSRSQQTPERTTQLAQASSPNTPYEVSSAKSSDSDCKIEKVLPSPSPKRKLVAASPQARPAKKVKMERSVAPSSGEESDCVIEKVLPSPKRPLAQQQRASIKRPKIGDSFDSPVSIESDMESDVDDDHPQPKPAQTQTPDQSRAQSPDIMDALLAWIDGPEPSGAASGELQQSAPPASESSPSNVPFSTAPEYPIEDPSDMGRPSRKVQDEEAQNGQVPASPASNLEDYVPPSAYELQPVYSGENLQECHTPGTPSSFRPHHRESLVGLKGILKRPSEQQARGTGQETERSPFPVISPLLRDDHAPSSPTERIQDGKQQAQIIRSPERRIS